MSQVYLKILVTGSLGAGKTSFITAANKLILDISNLKMLRFKQVNSQFPLNNYYKRKGVIILYDVSSMQSFKQALALASDITIPKLILGNKLDMDRQVHLNYAKKRSHQVSAAYSQICIYTLRNLKNSLDLIKEAILIKQKKRKSKRCKFRLKYKNVQKIRVATMILSIFNAISSIMLVTSAGKEMIRPSYKRPPQIISDTMILSGLVTFVISFIGLYGSKRSGIKEYLKSYYKILIGVAVYKVFTLFSYIEYEGSSDKKISIPILILSILVDFVASACTFVYNNAVMKVGEDLEKNFSHSKISIF